MSSFRARLLADLRWLLLSPPLWSAQVLHEFADDDPTISIQAFDATQRRVIQKWLDGLACDMSPNASPALADFNILATEKRLGRYAEQLLATYLAHGPLDRLLAHSLKLKNPPASSDRVGQSTRGEIDFLLTDSSASAWHWELAVKYFLCTAQSDQAHVEDFVGPERTESMSHKLRKLFGVQLRHTPPPPWNHTPWQRAAFARGWIFYPLGQPASRCTALAPDHCRGWWLARHDMDAIADEVFVVLPRLRWLAPAVCADQIGLLRGRAAVIEALSAQSHAAQPRPPAPVLLARLCWRGGLWHEIDRGFVVS